MKNGTNGNSSSSSSNIKKESSSSKKKSVSSSTPVASSSKNGNTSTSTSSSSSKKIKSEPASTPQPSSSSNSSSKKDKHAATATPQSSNGKKSSSSTAKADSSKSATPSSSSSSSKKNGASSNKSGAVKSEPKSSSSSSSSVKQESKTPTKSSSSSSSNKKRAADDSLKNESTSPKKRKKKEEEEEDVWRWWEEKKYADGRKWTTLEHKGPLFEPDYTPLPDDIHFFYNGERMKLCVEAEEVMTFYARMLDHDYTQKEAFNTNFFNDWRKFMSESERARIKELAKCDFTRVFDYFKAKTEERKAMSKEEKKKLKEDGLVIKNEYGFCMWDGHKQPIGNYRIEPPGLFRGRGEHPKMGMVKRRTQPEDVIINCSKGGKVPQPPPGHKRKEVRHDNMVAWLCGWTENVQVRVAILFRLPYLYFSPFFNGIPICVPLLKYFIDLNLNIYILIKSLYFLYRKLNI